MLYIYVAAGVIVGALAAIIFIYARKFAKAKTLDVATIAEEKQAILRDKILIDRLRRRALRGKNFAQQIGSPVINKISRFFERLYDKIAALEKKYQRESLRRPKVPDAAFEEKIKGILLEAEEYYKREAFAEAEKKYIEVISFDPSHKKAYHGLVDLYLTQKEFEQAIQIMAYIIKLDLKKSRVKDDKDTQGRKVKIYENADELTEDYLKLGEIYLVLGEIRKAASYFKKSFAINPHDPKTLDFLINASIMLKDKVAALKYFNSLKQVNPDNQKLIEYRKKIDEMKK